MSTATEFKATLQPGPNGRAYLDLPFDPDEAWGTKGTHHITGRVNVCGVRGPLTREEGTWRLSLGPAWLGDSYVKPGQEVSVVLAPEGPQLESLAPDLAAALAAEPEARAFFESLATFYRKAYLKWLDGASRRPAVREARLKELIMLLKAGKKTREEG